MAIPKESRGGEFRELHDSYNLDKGYSGAWYAPEVQFFGVIAYSFFWLFGDRQMKGRNWSFGAFMLQKWTLIFAVSERFKNWLAYFDIR